MPDLTAELAALWKAAPIIEPRAPTPPSVLPAKLTCPLDHRLPANWQYGSDRYNRPGVRGVRCRRCGKFYGYTKPPKGPTLRPQVLLDESKLSTSENDKQ